MQQVDFSVHPVDIGIIVLYFLFAIWLGFYFSKKHDTAEDYFLAGRSMLWPFIGFSLYASNMSSTSLVGLAGAAYDKGISFFNFEWMAAIVLIFFAIFILPFILRAGIYTMPEFLEKRFDRRARNYFSGLTLFLNIVVDTAGSLYAGGLLLQLIFPEISMEVTIALLAVAAGAYTIAGGLSAVIYTDTAQAILLTIGSTLIAIFAYEQVGGWSAITDMVPEEKLSLMQPIGGEGVSWLATITGVPLLGFYFWCTNQFMVQRVLSAKNAHHGRLGSLFAGLLKLPPLFIMVLPGTMALVLYQGDIASVLPPEALESGLNVHDMVFPVLMFDLLPVGILGIVLAGFVAALMSQIDSTLNSASTLVTMDFVREARPDLDQHQLMKVGRFVTFGFMLLAVLWAPQIQHFEGLFEYLQKVLAYTVSPVVALFIVGIFWKRANAFAAFGTLMVGLLVGAGLFISIEVMDVVSLNFLYVAPILFLLAVFTLVVLSLVTAPPPQALVENTTWSPAFFRAETITLREVPWYANYRILSVMLLALTAVVVGAFL
ncbi:sodium:solute symporter [Yunchengibacter salinarum]|uniref:sodium:solute symporter n=1 Tax=Yunchengibacter salinarum TaxID=3133399 RepID=UPI0035B5C1D6